MITKTGGMKTKIAAGVLMALGLMSGAVFAAADDRYDRHNQDCVYVDKQSINRAYQDDRNDFPTRVNCYGESGVLAQTITPHWDDAGNRVDVTVRSKPALADNWGPAPAFRSIDSNGDGVIDEQEAKFYPPLAADWLYVGQRGALTPERYDWWVRN